ncbi:MAG: hypothetical protein EAY75_06935 [Bacteroidetes bacterium]|nr:MAG: hypothetical protein EAY75_06935 [Bacteroidota bacterium]
MNAKLETVNAIFESMKADRFPIDEVLKWNFFFLDSSRINLIKIYNELRAHGYNLEALEQIDSSCYRMCVSKAEKLSPEKLHRRNVAFNELADYCNVQLYDGWDVERLV